MKNLNLGQAITIFANLGVIAGIVFLALELQQNNEIMEEQRRFNRLSTVLDSHATIVENTALAELVVKLDEAPDPLNPTILTPAERYQIIGYGMRILMNQEWQFRTLPREELPVASMRRKSKEAIWRFMWHERKAEFDPAFVEWIESDVLNH